MSLCLMTLHICQFLANAAFLKINKKVCIFQSITVFNVCVVAFKYDVTATMFGLTALHLMAVNCPFVKSLARPTKDIRHCILTS